MLADKKVLVLPPLPESKTVTVTFKVTASVAKAIGRAAADNNRSRSALMADLIELWLRETGYLK